eukprot:7377066-Prymnesium_polylepis.2
MDHMPPNCCCACTTQPVRPRSGSQVCAARLHATSCAANSERTCVRVVSPSCCSNVRAALPIRRLSSGNRRRRAPKKVTSTPSETDTSRVVCRCCGRGPFGVASAGCDWVGAGGVGNSCITAAVEAANSWMVRSCSALRLIESGARTCSTLVSCALSPSLRLTCRCAATSPRMSSSPSPCASSSADATGLSFDPSDAELERRVGSELRPGLELGLVMGLPCAPEKADTRMRRWLSATVICV